MNIVAKGLFAIVGTALAINTGSGQGRSPNHQMRFFRTSSPYIVKIELQPVKQDGLLGRSGWWGGGGRASEAAVSSFRIYRNHARILAPRSSYADLSNINLVSAQPMAGGMKIQIEGGDAHAGYDAEIVVKGKNVTQRTVRMGEFPQNYWERTTYVSIDPGG